jgi:ABC-type polar amino acid transport system ATPase subunit
MIEIERLEKSFGTNRVLDGISLQVRQGQVVCIIGPSGSGKTTVGLSLLGHARRGPQLLRRGDHGPVLRHHQPHRGSAPPRLA